jgi:glycosyltransferase involved in cell wall biosynthesis
MKIVYRISDAGYRKNKPSYVYPINIFPHFLTVFHGYEIFVIADNVADPTYTFLQTLIDKDHLIRTTLSNAGSFRYAIKFAIDNFKDDEKVYFAEDDYIYKKNAPLVIEEGLTLAEYSSGYDHPDKYINHKTGGPNPFIEDGGELTRVLITDNSHWKFTNSCCMTFATTIATLKADLDIILKYCASKHPNDFRMFQELIKYKKRKLVSSIPSVSTHGEIEWLAKFVDWEHEFTSQRCPV